VIQYLFRGVHEIFCCIIVGRSTDTYGQYVVNQRRDFMDVYPDNGQPDPERFPDGNWLLMTMIGSLSLMINDLILNCKQK
jgi:hypothetical protein